MSDRVLTSIDRGVLTITFNRPEKKNAFTREMYEGIVTALAKAESDPTIKVTILTGSGGSFTAGNDLGDFMQDPPKGEASPVFRFLLAILDAQKPILAAVEGAAVGIGTTMLLHLDLVYASATARFQLPFVNLGLVPEGASSFLLPRLTGPLLANELILFGEPFTAEVAQKAGLVNEVLAPDALLARVNDRARALAERPIGAITASKRLLKAGTHQASLAAMQREGQVFVERLASAETAEAVTAFFEKRKPKFD